MMEPIEYLREWILDLAETIAAGDEPLSEGAPEFLDEPALISALTQMLGAIEESSLNENQALYAACLFALDVCVSQLKFLSDNGNKRATRAIETLMTSLTEVIQKGEQGINFWLPVMSAFYDAQVELSPTLQQMYIFLAEEEGEASQPEDFDHQEAMRGLIAELSDFSTFELAAHFFAQSHAMPPEFFGDLVVDLCGIKEGQDVAILALLHSRAEVRQIALLALDSVIDDITLSSIALSRLQAIQAWLPQAEQETVMRWIRMQRKKGVIFPKLVPAKLIKAEASEIDGGGAEGLFLQLEQDKKIRLAGVLLKDGFGLKDAWITPGITKDEVARYCSDVLDDGVTLRRVDLAYIVVMMNHFLAITLEAGEVPGIHFLELQEVLATHFVPETLDVERLMAQLSVQIEPFTPEVVEAALKRSGQWLKTKRFSSSWYLENEQLDKLVNRCCHFADGVKVCRFEEAIALVFEQVLEPARAHWMFHFLWVALWLKAGARKNEKSWQDSFLIAHTIQSGVPLRDIPVMQSICHRSVVNSVETMRERRTHLSQE